MLYAVGKPMEAPMSWGQAMTKPTSILITLTTLAILSSPMVSRCLGEEAKPPAPDRFGADSPTPVVLTGAALVLWSQRSLGASRQN